MVNAVGVMLGVDDADFYIGPAFFGENGFPVDV